jgi:hypothetical protein
VLVSSSIPCCGIPDSAYRHDRIRRHDDNQQLCQAFYPLTFIIWELGILNPLVWWRALDVII